MISRGKCIALNQKFVFVQGGKMNNLNQEGYATVLTIIIIGLLGIIIFGLLNLLTLNHRINQSNESSIKAYYLGESGIAVLKSEIDSIFEKYSYEYINHLKVKDEATNPENAEEELQKQNILCFKDYAMKQNEHSYLQTVRMEEGLFEFYLESHGWRLEAVFEDEDITLYATGHYREARKRIVATLSYPTVVTFDQEEGHKTYQFIPSEILIYYQGYEGEYVD